MGKSYKLGSKSFRFKKDAISKVSEILHSYKHKQVLNETDFNIILDVFKMHKEYNSINNEIIKYIFVDFDGINSQCFHIKTKQNKIYHFSYRECFNPKNDIENFSKACRNSIYKFMIELKKDFFKDSEIMISQSSNKIITWDNSEVDHVNPTFNHIRDSFIKLWNINISAIEYEKSDKKSVWFKCKTLENRFIKYHNSIAYFLVVHKDDNSKRAKEEKVLENKYLTIKTNIK